MELVGGDATKDFWDVTDFKATLSATLTPDTLSTTLKIDNTGSAAFSHQAALHSYFGVSSLENLSISGSFSGASFIDKMDNAALKTEDREVITIAEEYDRIYSGVTDPTLIDTGTKSSLAVVNEGGFTDTVLWNPFGSEAMGYDGFVCVESAALSNTPVEAGESWEGKMTLKPTPIAPVA